MPVASVADRRSKDLAILEKFVQVYCHNHHRNESDPLCDGCTDLFQYAEARLERCPLDPKPKCKDCPLHCYSPEYRQRVQEVMKSSGMYFVKRGRLDWLIRYFAN
jgi:YbgA-like uncharacterized protein